MNIELTGINLLLSIGGIIASVAFFTGGLRGQIGTLQSQLLDVREDIKKLEVKQDKSNGVRERVALLERDSKTAFKRIDELKGRH